MYRRCTLRIAAAGLAVAAAGLIATGGGGSPASASSSFTLTNYGNGYKLWWNGNFKGQLRTSTSSSSLTQNGSKIVNNENYVQWQIVGSNNLCVEYDASNTAVIADTCTASRSAQWWHPENFPNGTYYWSLYQYPDTYGMFAAGNDSGSLVNANVIGIRPNQYYMWN
jgi:hypothetical protein